jgi:uncharacterized damage-inducible protein DinB
MSALSWKQYFIYQADYQYWANEVLFECLGRLDPKALDEPQGLHFSTIHRTLDHILVVEELWRLRLQGESPIVDFRTIRHPDWRIENRAAPGGCANCAQLETRPGPSWRRSPTAAPTASAAQLGARRAHA